MPRILLTNSYRSDVLKIVMSLVPDGFELISLFSSNKKELIKKAPEADYFIVSGRLPIDKEVIDAATKLKMIQRTGVGVDQIDLDVVREQNIPLYVNKAVNAQTVAEHTLLLMLAVNRKLSTADRLLKDGVWKKQSFGIQTRSLFAKTVGLIGLGAIGLELVKLLQPFGVNILYHKRTLLNSKIEKKYGLTYSSKQDLLKNSDVICLVCAYTPATHHILNNDSFKMMKPEAILVNTARGKLIDQKALIEVLKKNRIAGAALDVHYVEPLVGNHEFKDLSNVILTAHIGGITRDSFSEMYRKAFSNIQRFENREFDELEYLKV